jgi:hypothetical protein
VLPDPLPLPDPLYSKDPLYPKEVIPPLEEHHTFVAPRLSKKAAADELEGSPFSLHAPAYAFISIPEILPEQVIVLHPPAHGTNMKGEEQDLSGALFRSVTRTFRSI